MVIYKDLENDLVKAYSDQKMMIRGGSPEGLYSEAIDPKAAGRTYEETDIPVPEDEPEAETPEDEPEAETPEDEPEAETPEDEPEAETPEE